MTKNSIHTVWKEQDMQAISFSPELLREKTHRFERSIRWRNGLEYVAAAIAALFLRRRPSG